MRVTKFMSWLKPFLVLSIICGFAFTASAQTYYPVNVGNTWVLRSTDGAEQFTYTLQGPENVGGKELILLNIKSETLGTDTTSTDKYYITVEADGGLMLHESAVDQGTFGVAEATFDPPVPFFPADLPLEYSWEIVTETELNLVGATTATSTLTIVAIEDVETPAGTFKDCVKVEVSRRSVTALAVLRETFYQWLAPDVGPVKLVDSQDIAYELQSYSLVEPTVEPPAEPTEEPTDEGTEVEPPTEPAVETPMPPGTFSFDLSLDPGLNMISIPLMPAESYTAKSLAEMLEATTVIQLDATTQSFVAYTALDEDDGFDIKGGMGYIVNTPAGGMVTFTGKAWNDQSGTEAAPAAPALATAKSAWAFVVTSSIRNMEKGTGYTLVAENRRTGTIAIDIIKNHAKRSAAVWADLNRKSVVKVGDNLEITLYDERGTIVSGPFQRTVSTADIRNAFLALQMTVGDVRPKDTILAQNYPNPFNPETWIPYQLSKSAEVSIHIHNIAGHLIRTLDLGLKSSGTYMTPSTAAYWDGKNAAGESVASGIYFYTLQTADFAATRRMVILK